MRNAVVESSLVILRSRWHVAYNVFLRGGSLRKIGAGIFAIAAVVVMIGLFRLSALLVDSLRFVVREEPQLAAEFSDLERVLVALPSIAFTTISIPLLLGSVTFALGALYLANDLDLLLVSPAPMRAVFLTRFAEGLLPTYTLLLVLLLPSLLGYGLALGYGWAFFVAAPLVVAALPLLPMSFGVLVTMLLARIIPPRRLRELMAVLGGLMGIAVYIGTQRLTRSRRFDTADATERLLALDIPALPTAWASRLLEAAGRTDALAALRYGVPYAIVTLGLFGLTLVLTERLYYAGWIGLAGTTGGRVRRSRRGAWHAPLLRGPVAAILVKDIRTLPRDPQRLSQLLFPLALSGFWVWQLLSMGGGRFGGTVITSLTSITLLVCLLITSNVGLTSLSREGAGYWLLHLAPVSPWSLLWAKWTIAFLPFPIITAVFTVLIAVLRDPPADLLARSFASTVLTGVGVSAIATGVGSAFPRFNWSQAHRMTSVRAGCIAPVIYYLYAGTMLLLTLGSDMVYRGRWSATIAVAGWSIAVVLTALAFVVPLSIASRRLRRLEL